MGRWKIKISIEFDAKDFVQAEKVQGKIEERIMPLLLDEGVIRSWEINMQKKGR